MAEALTPRENQILVMVACGSTDKEIAALLGIARSTVSNKMSVILLKLGAANRAEAAAIARPPLVEADMKGQLAIVATVIGLALLRGGSTADA